MGRLEEVFPSKMFDRLNWDAAINQPVRGIEERAKRRELGHL